MAWWPWERDWCVRAMRRIPPHQRYAHPDFEALFAEAFLANPIEPRVAVPDGYLRSYEKWLWQRGWYRSGLGPNQYVTGWNVSARRREGLPPPTALDQSGDDTDQED